MKKVAFLIALAIGVQSCTDPDTTEPVIELVSLSPMAQPGLVCGQMEDYVITITSDDTLQGTIRISDDDDLSQYKLDIHNNFDCHGHGKMETTDWFVLDVVDLNGSEQLVDISIPVPSDVTTGLYHFSIQAADVSGNSAATIYYSLDVINTTDTEAPTLSVTAPANSSFAVQKGDPINFQGTLSDNEPLGVGGNGKIEVEYRSTSSSNMNELYSLYFDASTAETYNFDFDAIVPVTAVSGTYIFELKAFDGVNNASETFEFTVDVN